MSTTRTREEKQGYMKPRLSTNGRKTRRSVGYDSRTQENKKS